MIHIMSCERKPTEKEEDTIALLGLGLLIKLIRKNHATPAARLAEASAFGEVIVALVNDETWSPWSPGE